MLPLAKSSEIAALLYELRVELVVVEGSEEAWAYRDESGLVRRQSGRSSGKHLQELPRSHNRNVPKGMKHQQVFIAGHDDVGPASDSHL